MIREIERREAQLETRYFTEKQFEITEKVREVEGGEVGVPLEEAMEDWTRNGVGECAKATVEG